MPIVKRANAGNSEMPRPTPFLTEAELEQVLAEQPNLLSGDEEPPVALVQRQFGTLAGPADLLLVDADGLPIVVEVKLSKNREIRRQVVGQVFDYVSELASLTVDELDEQVRGRLQDAMRSLVGEDDDTALTTCWKACGVNLRAGKARVIVATDEAPDGLVRILEFLNEHSDLDVRLVEIHQYPDSRSGETIFVPKLIVYTKEPRVVRPSGLSASSGLRDEIRAILDEYRRVAPSGLSFTGSSGNQRKAIAPGWDKTYIHYEIIYWTSRTSVGSGKERIGAELHLESKKWSEQMVNAVRSLEPELAQRFGPDAVEWDPSWQSGRLAVMFDPQAPARDIAEAMAWFIEHTWQKVDEAYKREDWINT